MFADPNDTKPCPHMRVLVSAQVDGALSGLARWYTRYHVAHCAQCQKGEAAIIALRERMRSQTASGNALPEERWAGVEAAMEQADRS